MLSLNLLGQGLVSFLVTLGALWHYFPDVTPQKAIFENYCIYPFNDDFFFKTLLVFIFLHESMLK